MLYCSLMTVCRFTGWDLPGLYLHNTLLQDLLYSKNTPAPGVFLLLNYYTYACWTGILKLINFWKSKPGTGSHQLPYFFTPFYKSFNSVFLYLKAQQLKFNMWTSISEEKKNWHKGVPWWDLNDFLRAESLGWLAKDGRPEHYKRNQPQ